MSENKGTDRTTEEVRATGRLAIAAPAEDSREDGEEIGQAVVRRGIIVRIVLIPGSPFVNFQVDEPNGLCHALLAGRDWFCHALEVAYGCTVETDRIDLGAAVGREIYFGLHPEKWWRLEGFSPVETASESLLALYEARQARLREGKAPLAAAKRVGP